LGDENPRHLRRGVGDGMKKSLEVPAVGLPANQQHESQNTPQQKKSYEAMAYVRRAGIVGLLGSCFLGTFFLDVGEASAVWAAAAAIVIAAFTWTLSDATAAIRQGAIDTLRHEREATEREQRAYVMYKNVGKISPHSITLIFCNFGATPARDVQVFGQHSFASPKSFGPLLTHGYAAERSRISLAPSGEHWVEFSRPRQRFEEKAARVMYPAMYDGATTEYLHGRIEYTDAFGCRRYTWFKYWIRDDDTPQNCMDGNDWT
jgi:hypothetical protein